MAHRIWEGLARNEAMLDLLIPLSLLGFLAQRSENPAGMIAILSVWLLLRFLLHAKANTCFWFLIGVLVVSLADILDPLTISSPSDLILALLAFAAGAGRGDEQWRQSLWILSLVGLVGALFVELDGSNGNLGLIPFDRLRGLLPEAAIRIQRISINRSGYVFALISLLAYGLFRHSGKAIFSRLALLVFLATYFLAFMTGSRAAVGLPLLAIFIGEMAWWQRVTIARMAMPISMSILLSGAVFNLAIYADASPLSHRNPSDSGRADVAQCFLRYSLDSWPKFLAGHGHDRISDICREVTPPVEGEDRGPRHAHNTFLQILADHGLLSLLLFAGVIGLALARNLRAVATPGQGLLATVGITTCIFILGSALVESTLLKTSLQQVLTGYLLSLAWRTGYCSSSTSALVDHVGEHGEHEHVQA